MTTNTPYPTEPGDPQHLSGETQPGAPRPRRRGGRGHKEHGTAVPPSSDPAVPTTLGPTDARTNNRDSLPTFVGGTFATDRLNAEDWHDTRATNDDETLRRSLIWWWSKTLQRLATLAVVTVLYVVAAVVLLRLVPRLTPREAMEIAGAAVLFGSGGLAVNALLERIRRRRDDRR